METALSAYEDKVLRLVAEHGGRVLERGNVRGFRAVDGELSDSDLGEGDVPGGGPGLRELPARDRDEAGAWLDMVRMAVAEIGPLGGAWIGVCGLAGGRLPDAAADGPSGSPCIR